MILPINHITNWRYIRQRKQAQIEKDVINKKITRTDHNYQIMIRKHTAFKYETRFKGIMKLFKRGQKEPLPFKWERSYLE